MPWLKKKELEGNIAKYKQLTNDAWWVYEKVFFLQVFFTVFTRPWVL